MLPIEPLKFSTTVKRHIIGWDVFFLKLCCVTLGFPGKSSGTILIDCPEENPILSYNFGHHFECRNANAFVENWYLHVNGNEGHEVKMKYTR